MAFQTLRLEKWGMVQHARFPFVGRTTAIIIRTIWAYVLMYALAPDAHLAVVAGGHVEVTMMKVVIVLERRPIVHKERPERAGRIVRTISTSDHRRHVVVDMVVLP
jgi:hypothetical protein